MSKKQREKVEDEANGALARVTGKYFVTLASGSNMPDWFSDYQVKNLAQDVYELIPRETVEDVVAEYKKLGTQAGVKNVELDIVYLGLNEPAER